MFSAISISRMWHLPDQHPINCMMNRLLLLAAILIALGCASIRFFQNDPQTEPAKIAKASQTSRPMTGTRLQSSFQSPFSTGAPPAIDQAAVIADRVDRLKKLHYNMPDSYNKLSIKQLDFLARTTDKFAAIQLAERYWSEKDSAEWDPDFDFSASNKMIAEKYFKIAIRGGIFQAADTLAVKSAESGDVVDAQAWRIVSGALEKLGRYEHDVNVNIRQLSPAEEQAAAERAKKIWAELALQ